jgi:predicted DNA-binding transcriptional regulator AlpA
MSLPKLLTPDEVAAYLDVSLDTLARWRAAGNEGPAHVKIGQRVAYPESAVSDYITAQMTGSKAATPAALQAAIHSSAKEVGAAHKARVKEMQDLDRQTDEANPYAVTMSRVGETPNSQITHVNLCKPQDVIAPAAPHILSSR